MTMKRLAAFTLFFSLSLGIAQAATPGLACASLCGEWQLDATASDRPEQVLDAAFLQFKEPKIRRPNMPNTDNLEALGRAADEQALGPILDRPRGKELREELQRAVQQPRDLKISAAADDIRFAADGASPRGISPGERSSRVDRYGTARIDPRWRGAQLVVSEKYDRRNQQEITYSAGSDGALRVTQVIARQGLPRITVRSVYRKR
jgi:hypothetical protein